MQVVLVDVHRATHEHGGVDRVDAGQLVAVDRAALEEVEASREHVAEPMWALPRGVAHD